MSDQTINELLEAILKRLDQIEALLKRREWQIKEIKDNDGA